MTPEEKLYHNVKTGKIKVEQLNDKGKKTLNNFVTAKKSQEAITEKYGTVEQRGGSALARQRAEDQQAAKDAKSNINRKAVFGMTDKLKGLKVETKLPKRIESPALQKIKDQEDNLMQAGLSSTRSLMAKQAAEEDRTGRNIPVIGPALRGLDKLQEATKPFADVAMEVYTPGAGLNALNAATKGAEFGIAKLFPKLANTRLGRIASAGLREATVGVPATAGNTLTKTQDLEKAVKDGLIYGAGGGAVLGGVGRGVVEGFAGLKGLADEVARGLTERLANSKNALTRAANAPQYSGNLRLDNKSQNVSRIMGTIKDDVTQSMTPPLESEKALRAWIKPLMGNPSNNELAKLSYDDLVEIAEEARKSMNTYVSAVDVANTRGINLEQAFDQAPSIRGRVAQDASRRAFGFDAPKLPQVNRPIVNQPSNASAISDVPNARPATDVTPNVREEVLNSSPGRDPKPIKLDEKVIEFNESGVGDASTFGKKISSEPIKKKTSVSNWWEKTRTQLVDDMAPLEGMEKRISGKVASAEDSLYKSARMFKGTPERAAQVVQERLSPIVKGIEKLGRSTDDLGQYALAVHAKDVNAAGIKSGFTNAEIDDVIARFGTPEMESARQQLVQVNKDMLNELVDSGVVSRELASVLDDRWKNYIPLFRAFDDDSVEIGTGLSNALANVANPIKTLKGSERKVINPLENMVKNIFQSINSAERNKVASQIHRLNDIDTEDNFIRRLGDKEDVGRKNVVNVKVNGENVKYEVEPEVYKALLNLDKESSNMITNILSKPASLLRAGATLTPEFSLRNPMRDVVQAFVVSKSGFNPITDFGAGLIQTITKGNLHKEWIDNLGAYGNIMSMDRDIHRQALEKVLKTPVSKKFFNIVTGKSLINVLRYITDTTESATKVGEYRAALRKGVTKQEAAYRSRDIMDFARAGSGVRQANKMVAFLNANIQGKSKLIRAIKENPAGTTARAFAAVTVPTIGIYVSNKQFANDTQRETIDNAPHWMRNSFWLMAIPGTDVVARIPKPFDLATIFSNLPEKALEYTFENDKEAFDGFVSRAMKESALPMQISGLIPFIEGMSNYSFFREGDIVPQREQSLEYDDQYDPTRTTETAKFLAKGAEKLTGGKGAFKNFSSPRIMDNTIQGLTAGLGKYGTDAIDSILTGIRIPFTEKKIFPAIVDRPVSPEKSIEQKPFAKAFLVDPNQGGKAMDKFYTTINKLSKEKASAKLNEKVFGSNLLLKRLNSDADDVSKINKEIRSIEKSTLLSGSQKKMKIDRLIKDRNNIVKDSVKELK